MPAERRSLVDWVREEYGFGIRRACRVMQISRTVYQYQAKRCSDQEIIDALTLLAERHPRYGFMKLFQLLRRQGHHWNHKRVHRIYRELQLNFRKKRKKRLPSRNPEKLIVPKKANESWSVDFVSDTLYGGQQFRTFNLVDDFNREGLVIEIDTSLSAERITRVLDQVVSWRGCPTKIRSDNGPEFIAEKTKKWAEKKGIKWDFIKPGKPTQNAFIERFNRTYREEVLDFYTFNRLSEVREKTKWWLVEYNEERPHEALGHLTPIEYLATK